MSSSRAKGLTSAEGLYCKRLVKNRIEDITWTLENDVKKSRKLCLVKICIIQIILLLRGLNKEWCACTNVAMKEQTKIVHEILAETFVTRY